MEINDLQRSTLELQRYGSCRWRGAPFDHCSRGGGTWQIAVSCDTLVTTSNKKRLPSVSALHSWFAWIAFKRRATCATLSKRGWCAPLQSQAGFRSSTAALGSLAARRVRATTGEGTRQSGSALSLSQSASTSR